MICTGFINILRLCISQISLCTSWYIFTWLIIYKYSQQTSSKKIFGRLIPSSADAQSSPSRWRSHPFPIVASSLNCVWCLTEFFRRVFLVFTSHVKLSMLFTHSSDHLDPGWTVSVRPRWNNLIAKLIRFTFLYLCSSAGRLKTARLKK